MTPFEPLPAIRPAVLDDAAALAELGRRTFTDAFGATNTPDDLTAFLDATYSEALQREELASPSLTYFVAEHDGLPVAFALLRRDHPSPCVDDPTAVEMQRLYVDRRWHGTGLAQALMHHCLHEAAAGGAGAIFLGVWEQNARALRFYAAQGFEPVGQQVFVVGSDPQTDIVMRRRLVR
jgi:ribosomal protein S18 acetylase RimI-like enzyme